MVKSSTIYLVPFDDKIFSEDGSRDDCYKPFLLLKQVIEKLGFSIKITDLKQPLDDLECLLVFEVQSRQMTDLIAKYPRDKCILFLWEPPTVRPDNYFRQLHAPYGKIFTLLDDIIDNKTYFKFYYPHPRPEMEADLVDFSQKKLCALIACNKRSPYSRELYSKRKEAITFFELLDTQDFDLYGIGWPGNLRTYKGQVSTKRFCLKNYKFSLCYENTRDLSGYITEKIFDSFVAGCVPVYWGARNIEHYIPSECFIDRRQFESNEELYAFLKAISEQEYNKYIQAIQCFLDSDAAVPFSCNYFVDTILKAIKPDYDMNLVFSPNEQNRITNARFRDAFQRKGL